jgi:phosphoribosyl-ATP pyrophosphohydrolase/phosphoribosyl-AMP cyclohydrolase/histidinol dehydrogenase
MNQRLLRILSPAEANLRQQRPVDDETLVAAGSIIADIERRGDQAVIDHARSLGDLRPGQPLIHTPADLAAALERLPSDQRDLLQRVAARIRRFADAQRACLTDLTLKIPGGVAGHTCIPVRSAGCYAPGGRFPLPSSVLMTAVTARAAGVSQVWVASPRPTDVTLAAAAIAGVDGLLAIGGVQAITAMARGLVGVPTCDTIVGPGNRWVTAAKQLVSGQVGIDMLAGPSELVIVADDAADASLVAADLLAQAEHDDDAVPILVSLSEQLLEKVERELHSQLQSLPTRATARAALRNGFAVVVQTVNEAASLCDRLAPEHLQLVTQDAQALAAQVRNAGAVFIGPRSAEVLADYGAGPNHVLPTGGTARYRAGLSVLAFLRVRTWLDIEDSAAAGELAQDAAALARLESLEAHARAAIRRL